MNCVETSVIGVGGVVNSLVSDIVMIDFMCQLGYATVHRYLVCSPPFALILVQVLPSWSGVY